jgi:hypothetical protein
VRLAAAFRNVLQGEFDRPYMNLPRVKGKSQAFDERWSPRRNVRRTGRRDGRSSRQRLEGS